MITQFNSFLITRKQKELYKNLLDKNAIDEGSAITLHDIVSKKLAHKGILNAKYDELYGTYKFWIRQENEEKTNIYRIFVAYSSGTNIIIDNEKKHLIVLRYKFIYPWKEIRTGLNKLIKKLKLKQYELKLDGDVFDIDFWNKTKFTKFDFNGVEFIKVSN
jgi:hypothetical protein